MENSRGLESADFEQYTLETQMKHSIVLGAALCVSCMVACAVDDAQEAGDHSSVVVDNGSEAAGDSVTQSFKETNSDFTSVPFDVIFPSDGCHMIFWCHNDNAVGNAAGFCIKNNCGGNAVAHAVSFCPNHCASGCNVITNFGACGPG